MENLINTSKSLAVCLDISFSYPIAEPSPTKDAIDFLISSLEDQLFVLSNRILLFFMLLAFLEYRSI